MNETLKQELSQQAKIGIYLNIVFNIIVAVYLIYFYIVFHSTTNIVGLRVLGMELPVDAYAYTFLAIPLFTLLSLILNIKVLNKDYDQQGKAILFSFLSGSLIGSFLLHRGRVKLEPIHIQSTPKKQKRRVIHEPHYNQPIQPLQHQMRLPQGNALIDKYRLLHREGLISDQELQELIDSQEHIH